MSRRNQAMLIVLVCLLISCYSQVIRKNPVLQFMTGVEIQCENDLQKNCIINAFQDMILLSGDELALKKYPDYSGKEGQWNLETLIYKYCVPEKKEYKLGDNFYKDIKEKNVIKLINQIVSRLRTDK